jgi:NAD(P)-dependent dehydrogenase (short-subunit alcohol dehydrogenase family)
LAISDVSERSISDLLSLKDRVAVVTGGAAGIGYAICERLAEAGAHVLIGDMNVTAAHEAAHRLSTRRQAQVIAVELNVLESSSITALADRAVSRFGRLDIWVNNAGAYPSATVLDITDEGWDRLLNLNLRGTFIGAREAAKRMIAAGRGGAILNLASTAAFKSGGGNAAHYVTSKHGVVGLTKSLAVELGPHNIRVLALAPTLANTPGVDEKRQWLAERGLSTVLEEYAAKLPLGRAGVPDDMARVALFCVSDMAMFMTGSVVFVDGGDMTG